MHIREPARLVPILAGPLVSGGTLSHICKLGMQTAPVSQEFVKIQ